MTTRPSLRIAIWFWGTGGAGVRLVERFAGRLSTVVGPEQVSILCHARAGLDRDMARRGHPVSTVAGAAGHRSKLSLMAGALPRLGHLWRHLRAHRPDLVLIPMNFALAWPFGLLPRLMGIDVAYMVHDALPHPGDFAPGWQRATQRRLLGLATSVLAPSRYTAEAIAKQGAPDRPVHVIPLSALTPARRSTPRGDRGGSVRLLFLGRLIAYKGLLSLADALKPLSGRRDWSLTIAGAGPDEAIVRAAFASMPQVDLSRLRFIEEAEIEHLISTHDVLVCPYTEASQSGVVPEGQADAMPCIVTPVGALPEQTGFGKGGWIARGTTAEDLSACLIDMLEHPAAYLEKSRGALAVLEEEIAPTRFEGLVADWASRS